MEGAVDSSLVTAEEILNYAEEEFEKALRKNDTPLYLLRVRKVWNGFSRSYGESKFL